MEWAGRIRKIDRMDQQITLNIMRIKSAPRNEVREKRVLQDLRNGLQC